MRKYIRKLLVITTAIFMLAAAGCDKRDNGGHGHEGHDEHESHADTPAGHEEHGPEDGDDEVHGDAGFVELTDEQSGHIDVRTGTAGPGVLATELSFTGEVRLNGDRVAHVVPKVSGVVSEVNASLGSKVRKGQVLAVMQSADLSEAKSDYIDRFLQREVALKAYERKKALYEEKIASKADLLEKEAEYLKADSALVTASRRLAVLGLSEEELSGLPNAQGAGFGVYRLLAPISGTVTARHITIGEHVGEDAEVFTVADTSTVWVDLMVPSRDVPHVRPGVEADVISSLGSSAKGRVSIVGPLVDEDTRSMLARIVMDNKGGEWVPGTFVNARVYSGEVALPVVVPQDAVQSLEGEDVVFVPDGHGFRPVDVVTGRSAGGNVEIVSGLEPGTRYVTHGAFELKSVIATRGMGSHAGHGH